MKAAAIIALASTASAQYFGMMAARSASPIHLQQVEANGQHLWIGKDTKSYCPPQVSKCPKGKETLFGTETDIKTLSMAVEVPGGQQVFVDPKDGALGYTQAHSAALPEGAIREGFVYTAPEDDAAFGFITYKKRDFMACSVKGNSTEGPWKVYANLRSIDFDDDACLGFSGIAPTGPKNGTKVGAWEYL